MKKQKNAGNKVWSTLQGDILVQCKTAELNCEWNKISHIPIK